MPSTSEIIIVGAGLSGLTAAYHLQQAGHQVIVLEARERIGGRIHTVTPADGQGTFDLGPAWFWGHQQHVIEFLQQFNLGYFPQYESGYHMFERQPGATPQRFTPQWQQPTSYRIVGGTITLAQTLADQLAAGTIHLNHAVTEITQQADSTLTLTVNSDGKREQWKAQHVIVTLPPHLAATAIAYTPALPVDLTQAMRSTPTWMGEAMKVSLVYDRPFWRDSHLSGYAISYAGPVQQFHDATPADESVGALFGWLGNHSPGRNLTIEARQAAVIAQATRLFGAEASHPRHYAEANWEREPFTTHPQTNGRVQAQEHPTYGHPLLQMPQMNGRLWWAVTEASPIEGGYLDGALYIGEQIAKRIGSL